MIVHALLVLAAVDTSRLVTLGGSATETVYALGAGARVVGVDTSSLYPPEVTQKPNVGYVRSFSVEGVLSLGPTAVIAVDSASPREGLDQLRSAGIEVVMVPTERSVAGARERVVKVAEALGNPAGGRALVARIDAEMTRVEALVARASSKPRVLFVYARGSGTLNVAGRETGADEVLRLAGATNAVKGFAGYRPLTSESVVKAAPDVLLVTKHGLKGIGGRSALLKIPGIAFTPAAKGQRIVVMDDLLLLGFGPRVAEAVTVLARHLHPELFP